MSDLTVTVVQPAPVGPVIVEEQGPPEQVTVTSGATQGPPGPPGVAGVAQSFAFTFATPSATWVVNHSLGRLALVAVFDGAGDDITDGCVVAQPNTSTVIVSFNNPQTGSVTII